MAEADGRLSGNVVLWSPPGNDVPMDIVLFEADGEATARLLLDEAGALAKRLGATTQGHALDHPAQAPQFQHDREFRERVLGDAGFVLTRDGCRFRWVAATPVPPEDSRLTWRSLAELGEKPFVDILTDVLSDTKDSLLLKMTAEELWNDSLSYEHSPQWYEIGFDVEGNAAAISLPARSPSFPVIGFVGVASAHRGHGYANAVVARGTQILVAAGATEIRGECSAANYEDNPKSFKQRSKPSTSTRQGDLNSLALIRNRCSCRSCPETTARSIPSS